MISKGTHRLITALGLAFALVAFAAPVGAPAPVCASNGPALSGGAGEESDSSHVTGKFTLSQVEKAAYD